MIKDVIEVRDGVIMIDGVRFARSGVKPNIDGVRRFIASNPLRCASRQPEVRGDYVVVPLPNANTMWTFEVWNWVRRFVEEFPLCYPVHETYHKNDKYQYIDISMLR